MFTRQDGFGNGHHGRNVTTSDVGLEALVQQLFDQQYAQVGLESVPELAAEVQALLDYPELADPAVVEQMVGWFGSKLLKKAGRAVKSLGHAVTHPADTMRDFVRHPVSTLATTGAIVFGGTAALAGEVLRAGKGPKVLTTFIDPAGAIRHAAASGAEQRGNVLEKLRGAGEGTVKGVRDVTGNPLIKATAAGLTFIIPPAGAALTAGMAALNRGAAAADAAFQASHGNLKPALAQVQHLAPNLPVPPGIHNVAGAVGVAEKLVAAHMHGTPQVKQLVGNLFKKTAALAKTGDADAKRALLVLITAKQKLNTLQHFTYHVDTKGKVTRGAFKLLPTGQRGSAGYYVRADGHVQRGNFARA